MSGQREEVLGALISLTPPPEGGNYWVAKQDKINQFFPPGDPRARYEIDWSFGPFKDPATVHAKLIFGLHQVTGYVDTTTWEAGISVTVAGINLGTIYGNLKDGIGIKVDLFVAKGELRFYLKNGNEVWVHFDVKIIFDGHFKDDVKIFSV
ncbi:Uncharacterized protein TPAR_06081 [Tolypocladium paradoxum]|uniref:Uncharacterized protein n=1 Tax=Tolypocladium paradoxum TaxID=94208 RepID=A0A2S4KU89_9HYPO|nr:Uncharacterized protein TPAR_06081 [Tolypocladium paradoxum]